MQVFRLVRTLRNVPKMYEFCTCIGQNNRGKSFSPKIITDRNLLATHRTKSHAAAIPSPSILKFKTYKTGLSPSNESPFHTNTKTWPLLCPPLLLMLLMLECVESAPTALRKPER